MMDPASVEQEIASLKVRVREVENRCGTLEEAVDLLQTTWWRRLGYRLNGWPRLPVPASKQRWRPWHRWWGRRDR